MLMKRFYLAYAILGYAAGLASIAYLVGFLADFGVPKGISDGKAGGILPAAALDTGLVLLFGLHHSLTARTAFKRWWTRFVPPPIERATYLFMSAAMVAGLVALWRPIPVTLWHVEAAWAVTAIYAAYLGVWALMVAATFHFGHLGFFGISQAWDHLRGRAARPGTMTARYLYALVRHPISTGWMLTPFLVPHLTLGHAVFGLAAAAYILVATPFEEADLEAELGADYGRYRERVPAFFPRFGRRAGG